MNDTPQQLNPQPSINTFMNVAKAEPLFQQLPEDIQKSIEQLEIDNPVDLLKFLSLRASILLGNKQKKIGEIKIILQFAQKLAGFIADKSREMQISAWLDMLELEDKELLHETITTIRQEIRQTFEYKEFEKEILGIE